MMAKAFCLYVPYVCIRNGKPWNNIAKSKARVIGESPACFVKPSKASFVVAVAAFNILSISEIILMITVGVSAFGRI